LAARKGEEFKGARNAAGGIDAGVPFAGHKAQKKRSSNGKGKKRL